jgi:hypothetical protein
LLWVWWGWTGRRKGRGNHTHTHTHTHTHMHACTHLDYAVALRLGVQRELNVALADDAEVADHLAQRERRRREEDRRKQRVGGRGGRIDTPG